MSIILKVQKGIVATTKSVVFIDANGNEIEIYQNAGDPKIGKLAKKRAKIYKWKR